VVISNSYYLKEPTIISFSGGRTSAYLLYQIIQAHGGELPDYVYPVFANTGKEMPQTLDFIKDCEEHWGCKVYWMELSHIIEDGKGPTEKDRKWMFKYKETDYKNCSRNGEPFEIVINHYNKLPNATNRFCTYLLKQRAITWFERINGLKHPDQVLGLRYDEPRRVHNIINKDNKYQDKLCPLYTEKVTQETIKKFWDSSNFDLKLVARNGHTILGNCDMCFLKGKKQTMDIMRSRPELSDWWIEQETRTGKTFRFDIPVVDLLKKSKQNINLDLFESDESLDCFCTD
jgi:3'-phosphoadenosine 5'-phosphosulfate sulfotransferase (PAPS reductase)/FAD synthetase